LVESEIDPKLYDDGKYLLIHIFTENVGILTGGGGLLFLNMDYA